MQNVLLVYLKQTLVVLYVFRDFLRYAKALKLLERKNFALLLLEI